MKQAPVIAIQDLTEENGQYRWVVVIIRKNQTGFNFSREKYRTNFDGCGIYKDNKFDEEIEIEKPEKFSIKNIKTKRSKIKVYFDKIVNGEKYKCRNPKKLTPRETEVIKLRDEDKKTRREIGKMLGITTERVRQVEANARKKMKNAAEKRQ